MQVMAQKWHLEKRGRHAAVCRSYRFLQTPCHWRLSMNRSLSMNRVNFTRIAGLVATLTAAAPVEAAIRIGALECNVARGVGLVITSSRTLACVFRASGGRREHYFGTVRRFGLDLGVTGAGRLVWGVFAPSRPGPGALAGDYVGASGAISVGVGVGANALVGGLNNSFTLQPLSLEAQTGASIAAGIGDMRLGWDPPRVHRRLRMYR